MSPDFVTFPKNLSGKKFGMTCHSSWKFTFSCQPYFDRHVFVEFFFFFVLGVLCFDNTIGFNYF